MGKHTDGPWERRGTEVYFPYVLGGFSLRGCPNAEGNAALCASAPELLATLELAAKTLDEKLTERGHGCVYSARELHCALFSQIDAAIAKAKGEV